ncbi:hypothetical protein [Acidovorax sp. 107]|nr:hypothetical protein [Acidovorax sp. 107]
MATRKDEGGAEKTNPRKKTYAKNAPISANPKAVDSKKMELLDHKSA